VIAKDSLMKKFGPFDRLISLGSDCQAATNIQLFSGSLPADFFNWIATPLEGLIDTIETDFAHILHRENVIYTENFINKTVVDSRNGFDFFHFFSHDATGGVNENAIEQELDSQREKFKFLADRWLSTMNNARILFVRVAPKSANLETIDDLLRVHELLSRKYPSVESTILSVIRQKDFDNTDSLVKHFPYLYSAKVKDVEWPGDPETWNVALRSAVGQ
jgi:hypothetical protein